jgi:hypothetical protein
MPRNTVQLVILSAPQLVYWDLLAFTACLPNGMNGTLTYRHEMSDDCGFICAKSRA